jgi:very-short-patch-repair endonuclease
MYSENKYPIQITFARELRKNQTPAEVKVWDLLRNRRFLGFKFLRQHPIVVEKHNGKTGFYIADFYCSEKKLVIEIDGLIHTFQIDYDKARDVMMNELGLTIFRITNDEVEKNVFEVLNKIKLYLR